jgi:hypothetical protein
MVKTSATSYVISLDPAQHMPGCSSPSKSLRAVLGPTPVLLTHGRLASNLITDGPSCTLGQRAMDPSVMRDHRLGRAGQVACRGRAGRLDAGRSGGGRSQRAAARRARAPRPRRCTAPRASTSCWVRGVAEGEAQRAAGPGLVGAHREQDMAGLGHARGAGRAGGAGDALRVEQHQQRVALTAGEGEVGVARQPVRSGRRAVQRRVGHGERGPGGSGRPGARRAAAPRRPCASARFPPRSRRP